MYIYGKLSICRSFQTKRGFPYCSALLSKNSRSGHFQQSPSCQATTTLLAARSLCDGDPIELRMCGLPKSLKQKLNMALSRIGYPQNLMSHNFLHSTAGGCLIMSPFRCIGNSQAYDPLIPHFQAHPYLGIAL